MAKARSVDELNRLGEMTTEIIEKNPHAIWDAQVNLRRQRRLKVKLPMSSVNSNCIPTKFSSVAPQLFNIDPQGESKKPLSVRLDLYQMEDF